MYEAFVGNSIRVSLDSDASRKVSPFAPSFPTLKIAIFVSIELLELMVSEDLATEFNELFERRPFVRKQRDDRLS